MLTVCPAACTAGAGVVCVVRIGAGSCPNRVRATYCAIDSVYDPPWTVLLVKRGFLDPSTPQTTSFLSAGALAAIAGHQGATEDVAETSLLAAKLGSCQALMCHWRL